MANATARDILHRFMQRQGDPVIVSPICSETLPIQLLGAGWGLKQGDARMIEAKLRLAEICGFVPIVKMEQAGLGFLLPHEEILEATADRKVIRNWYDHPEGRMEAIITRMAHGMHVEKKMIQSVQDTLKMVWLHEQADYEAFGRSVRRVVDLVGDRGIVAFNVGHCFGSFDDQVTNIFFAFEHPQQMREAADRMLQVKRRMMDVAAREGVRCFFTAQLASNMYSPDMVDQWITPYMVGMREHAHRLGAVFYLHECGSMRGLTDRGVYDRIQPDWLEGFEAPPLGDTASLRQAREKISPEIVFKGNLNIEFLQKARPGDIEQATLEVLEQVRGYRHIVGGACSLLAGTPLANVRAMSRATARYCGRPWNEDALRGYDEMAAIGQEN